MVHQVLALDIGNVIYIIFLVIVGIINVLGKNRKKKGKTPSRPRPTRESRETRETSNDIPPTLEQLIAKLADSQTKSEPTPPKPEPITFNATKPVKPKESVKQTQPKKPEYTFTPKSEQRTSRGNERTQERTTSIVEDLEEDIAQGIEFDARKAIIYSEILRRPDF